MTSHHIVRMLISVNFKFSISHLIYIECENPGVYAGFREGGFYIGKFCDVTPTFVTTPTD